MARIDKHLNECRVEEAPVEVTNKINALTLGYVAHCNGHRQPRIVDKTAKWLSSNEILAYRMTKERASASC